MCVSGGGGGGGGVGDGFGRRLGSWIGFGGIRRGMGSSVLFPLFSFRRGWIGASISE